MNIYKNQRKLKEVFIKDDIENNKLKVQSIGRNAMNTIQVQK